MVHFHFWETATELTVTVGLYSVFKMGEWKSYCTIYCFPVIKLKDEKKVRCTSNYRNSLWLSSKAEGRGQMGEVQYYLLLLFFFVLIIFICISDVHVLCTCVLAYFRWGLTWGTVLFHFLTLRQPFFVLFSFQFIFFRLFQISSQSWLSNL